MNSVLGCRKISFMAVIDRSKVLHQHCNIRFLDIREQFEESCIPLAQVSIYGCFKNLSAFMMWFHFYNVTYPYILLMVEIVRRNFKQLVNKTWFSEILDFVNAEYIFLAYSDIASTISIWLTLDPIAAAKALTYWRNQVLLKTLTDYSMPSSNKSLNQLVLLWDLAPNFGPIIFNWDEVRGLPRPLQQHDVTWHEILMYNFCSMITRNPILRDETSLQKHFFCLGKHACFKCCLCILQRLSFLRRTEPSNTTADIQFT